MKPLLQNQEFQLDEILFENRNKAYGAYALRHDADRILTKALFLGIGLFAAFAITPLAINAFSAPPVENIPATAPPTILQNVDRVEDPEVQPVKPEIKVPVNTVDSRVVTPTRNAKVETVMPKQTEKVDAVLGTSNITGEPPVISYQAPPISTGTVPAPDVQVPKPIDNSPKTTVDVQAVFNGGIDAFRNKVINNFDTSVMEGTGEVVRTTVVFIVEKDGTISEVKATGPNVDFNRAAEKTIRSVKGKWAPAKIKGDNVRSYFKFPISMQFE
ncbi:energy transducer TonB [Chryseobacterium sp. H3056]|uniref:Energy transducer TonB n=2 Tax=Kaistella daneshvariae TaxID=2487074 RepID=A0A3N0WW89_9FLAO|nr:energy transducer TonB [Kaistella daneshvariae]